MAGILSNLEPKAVFSHFEDLTRIPRESGNEKMVSDFLMDFAKNNGLTAIQEDSHNVIIEKPASPGYENAPKVILQGHMDMVCVKKPGFEFDFEKDAIPIAVDGDIIKTEGTSLGADNGIAVAMAMAILESKEINHPAISALITSAEETGMDGAINLQPGNISGDILINIDSEEEGKATVSCAGGVRVIVNLPLKWENVDSKDKVSLKLQIDGLAGGHSGMEINKNRANAIRLMGRTLNALHKGLGDKMHIADISGGEKMNAIPKHSQAVIVTSASEIENIKDIVSGCHDKFSNEFKTSDPGISISVESMKMPEKALDNATTNSIIDLALLIPTGVQTMSADIDGLVESSSNIGVLELKDSEVLFESAVRSSVRSLKDEISDRIEAAAQRCGATVEKQSDYPEWEYKAESPIRDLMMSIYKEKYGKDLKVDAIHAGLECGLLKEKIGDIDMISIGPNMYDVHTPNESLSISSTARVFGFLCDVLEKIK